MPTILPKKVQEAIDAFARLPGIGPKMASRLTFHLLKKSEYDLTKFIDSLDGIRTGLEDCEVCGNISAGPKCTVCLDSTRDNGQICVVESPLDVIAMDKTGIYSGSFHVLGGALSPIDGIGPDQLRINSLMDRLKERMSEQQSTEVIIATNPSLQGEATAVYLHQQFQNLPNPELLSISRIARGLPMGSDLEYADPTTLQRALEGRKAIE